jgi:hypothetical protein
MAFTGQFHEEVALAQGKETCTHLKGWVGPTATQHFLEKMSCPSAIEPQTVQPSALSLKYKHIKTTLRNYEEIKSCQCKLLFCS